MLFDILKVGVVACFSPLQSVLSINIFTYVLVRFGTETLAGFGIGARLEFMLTSVAFSAGIASVPMIGMAIGAGRVARARRIAWTAGCVAFAAVGFFGTLIAIFSDLWVDMFASDPGVRAASRQYLSTAAPMYAFIGLSIAMYFSSQGAAKGVRAGAGADRAPVVHLDRQLVADTAWRHRRRPRWGCSALCPP
jgi:Na+-driven multidrug efflux pump